MPVDTGEHKLPAKEKGHLFAVSVSDIVPFKLHFSRCYIYLPKNEKFVSIKGPFEFFTNQERDRYHEMGTLYFWNNSCQLMPIIQAAQSCRWVLHAAQSKEVLITGAFVSRVVARMITPLFRHDRGLLAADLVAFVETLLDPLSERLYLKGREEGAALFESRLITSACAVVIALFAGNMSPDSLSSIRILAYEKALPRGFHSECGDLVNFSNIISPDSMEEFVDFSTFHQHRYLSHFVKQALSTPAQRAA